MAGLLDNPIAPVAPRVSLADEFRVRTRELRPGVLA